MTVFFDLDGTLTDPFPGITACIRHALGELGLPIPDADRLRWCIGPPLRESFIKLLGPGQAALADQAVSKYRERFSRVGLFENAVYPGIAEMLGGLVAEGTSLYVATSKPQVFASRIIDHFGLRPYFISVEGSELDGARADKRVLIEYMLTKHRLDPAQVVMVGDREHDMAGAAKNQVAGLGVLWGYGSAQELHSAGAYACAVLPGDVSRLVRDRPGRTPAGNPAHGR